MNLTVEHIGDAVRGVARDYDVEAAYVFGSFARGDASGDSDVDIRLECGPSMRYGLLDEIRIKLEGELGRNVDIVTCRPEYMRERFRDHVQRDEVQLYGAA